MPKVFTLTMAPITNITIAPFANRDNSEEAVAWPFVVIVGLLVTIAIVVCFLAIKKTITRQKCTKKFLVVLGINVEPEPLSTPESQLL